MKVQPYEEHYQVGNVIQIRSEPPKARRYGFLFGTEHEIQPPPLNATPSKNSAMGVWVKSRQGELKYLQFMYWSWLGKVNKIQRTRKNAVK